MKTNQALLNSIGNGFQLDDLVDATVLGREIAASEKPLATYLRAELMTAQLLPLPDYATSDAAKYKAAMVEQLNVIIGGDSLYTDARFAGVKLTETTRKLRRKNPTGADLVKFNKFLLLDAFVKHFRRKPGRGKSTVQNPAVVRPLKGGKFGVFVDLVAHREILGQLRTGRQKFERPTKELANDLCVDINNVLFGKEIARQLTPAEIAAAKDLFWKLLEPEHAEWIPHLDQLVAHCEKTGFRVDFGVLPTIADAVKLFWAEHVHGLEPESRMNFRNAFAFALPAFGKLKSNQMSDPMVLQLAHGDQPLDFFATSWKKRETQAQAEARLWDTPTKSDSRRPWSYHMKVRFLSCIRKFKIWMHESVDPKTQEQRNWCMPTSMQVPKKPKVVSGKSGNDEESEEVMEIMKKKNPALTVPQCQALLDVAHIAFDAYYAAFYVHGLFGGSRVKETKKMGAGGFDAEDGVQAVATQADKNDEARESALLSNLIIMVEALKATGLYKDDNLRPNHNQRAAIHILAGFHSNSKQAHQRAARERKRLAALGVSLPEYDWKVPFPKNALRRTSLSMHFKLFGSAARTVEWAGNSVDIFRPYYKRLVSKSDARKFWIMLPAHLKGAGVIALLPIDHKLDSAMTVELARAIASATEMAKQAVVKVTEAKASAAAARPAELKARIVVYNKRANLKRKARKLAALQQQQLSEAVESPPLDQAA